MARAGRNRAAAILVAEDDTAVREFVSRALLRHGYDVTAVADGAQALEALDGAEFALLLADVAMPEVDGVALSLEAAKAHPEMPILLMTGYAAERERAGSVDALVHGIVAKPFTLRQICAAAHEAIAESRSDRRTDR
jgi:DNA-binding NtrC family response regulator